MSDKSSALKLNNMNYEVWSILADALLTRKGVDDALHVPMPTQGPNSPVTKAWMKKNSLARAELILSVEPDQLAHMTSPYAAVIWKELEHVHRARGFATRLALCRKFLTLKKCSDQPMSQWILDVRSLAFCLRGIGVNTDDEDLILVLTMGLPTAYDNFVIALDAADVSQLTLEHVISRLLNEESRHSYAGATKPIEPTALAVAPRTGGLAHITCYSCGKKGHYQANCPDHTESPKKTGGKESAHVAMSAASSGASGSVVDIYDEGW